MVDQTRLHGNSKYARAASLAAFPKDQYVCSAHVPHPMLRRELAKAFHSMRPLFMQNASYRFRDARQFFPVALHDHLVLKRNRGLLRDRRDSLHISGTMSKRLPEEELRSAFSRLFAGDVKFACLNNMPSTMGRLGVTEGDLERLFGPSLPFEQERRGRFESIALKVFRRHFFTRPVNYPRESKVEADAIVDAHVRRDSVDLRKRDRTVAKRARDAVFRKVLRDVCEGLQREGNGYFLQIGANDGIINDPLSATVKEYMINGLCVEPLPEAFSRLEKCYAKFPGVHLANVAIGPSSGTATLYLPKLPGMDSATGRRLQRLSASAERKASFLPDVARRIAARKHKISEEDAGNHVNEVTVRVLPLEHVLAEHRVTRIDILQIDVEGFDFEVLKQLDFDRYSPVIVNFEHQHLSEDDKARSAELLAAQGYVLFRHGRDTCGIRTPSCGEKSLKLGAPAKVAQ